MLPMLTFGEFASDNNSNKMLGGRLGLVLAPRFEVNVSGLSAKWGEAEAQQNAGKGLSFWGYNLAVNYWVAHFELRAEGFRTGTQIEQVLSGGAFEIATVRRWGGYAQASYRKGSWEPTVRFSLVEPNEDQPSDRLTQYGVGLNYWFSPSIAVMAAYEVNRDKLDQGRDLPNDRLMFHWAFGF